MSGDKMRWGLLGASTIARERIVNAIRSSGGDVASVYSSDQKRADVFAYALGIARRTTVFVRFASGLVVRPSMPSMCPTV